MIQFIGTSQKSPMLFIERNRYHTFIEYNQVTINILGHQYIYVMFLFCLIIIVFWKDEDYYEDEDAYYLQYKILDQTKQDRHGQHTSLDTNAYRDQNR